MKIFERLLTRYLVKLWNEFITELLETNPNYIDSDFTFDNFMHWIRKRYFNN